MRPNCEKCRWNVKGYGEKIADKWRMHDYCYLNECKNKGDEVKEWYTNSIIARNAGQYGEELLKLAQVARTKK